MTNSLKYHVFSVPDIINNIINDINNIIHNINDIINHINEGKYSESKDS